jgi:putative transcriptional regulator
VTAKGQYRSEALGSIHETMNALYEIGAISKVTMHEFDELCLEPVLGLKQEEIRTLRERENVSQPVFAHYLNVSKNLVSDWERGKRKPGRPALKLLDVIQKHGLQLMA